MPERELEKTVDETTKHDTRLGGWHAIWLGAAYYLEGDKDSSILCLWHCDEAPGTSRWMLPFVR